MDAGDDAGGGNRHAREWNADAGGIYKQANRLHKIFVIEKGLALPHEDQINALAFDIYAALAQHR